MTHGMHGTKIYSVWCDMRSRCLNSRHPAYKNYGGRGITLCERWEKFANFYADMGDVPTGMTLDRVDNNGPYSKENCKWSTHVEQVRNRRMKRLITANGVTKAMWEWAEESGLNLGTIHKRLSNGWSAEDAVLVPLITKKSGVPKGTLLREVWKAELKESL